MTITIADGRGALWQWDTGRRLRVGSGVEQIHYQNRALGGSVDVDVGADGTAIIPDELLQDCHTLTAYVYVTDDTGAYTMEQQDFIVHKRAKPAGYVYTPTDQITLQTIQSQIGDLADLTTEAKDTLVAAINEVARTGGGAGSMGLRVADGYIQYSTDSGSTWQNLIAVADLEGADGITPTIGDNGNWYLGEEDTGKPSRGETGPQGTPGIYYGTTPPTGDTHPVWIDPDGGPDDGGLLPAVTDADNGKVLRVVSSAWTAADMPTGGTDMGITGAAVGQIAKITAVDSDGKPTAWSPVDMPEALPNPNALTFTGAVEGSYDGSEPVTVEIPSGGGGSGGGKTLTLIAEATMTDEADFAITKDLDGNSISESELIITAKIEAVSENRDINVKVLNEAGEWIFVAAYGFKTGTSAMYHEHRLCATGEYIIDYHSQSTSLGWTTARVGNIRMVSFSGKICGIGSIGSFLNSVPAGSVVKLYAWR